MVELKDFTNKELVNVIADWYESLIGEAHEPFEILEMIKNNKWLDWVNQRIAADLPHNNC